MNTSEVAPIGDYLPTAMPGPLAQPTSMRAGRSGFERVRKPVALLCAVGWLGLAVVLPTWRGGWIEAGAVLGHLLVAAAVAGRLWSTLHIGGLKNGRLCRSGPYALTRNPLYFFSWLGVTGIALVFRQPWLVVAASAGFALSFAPLIHAEERRLSGLFGEAYRAYQARVPRFFPRWRAATEGGVEDGQTPGKLDRIERALADAVWFLITAALVEVAVADGLWAKLQAIFA